MKAANKRGNGSYLDNKKLIFIAHTHKAKTNHLK